MLFAQDVENTLAELIEAGEKVETDMLSQLSSQLPPEVMDAIPSELKSAFPGLRPAPKEADPFTDDWEVPTAEAPYAATTPKPYAVPENGVSYLMMHLSKLL